MVDWEEIGKGDKTCQNPPILSKQDTAIWNWYHTNISSFAREFNLMPMMIKKLNLEETDEYLFLHKLGMIHQSMLKIQREEIEKESKR